MINPQTLGCAGCKRAKSCSGGLSGVGCPRRGLAGLGFAVEMPQLGVDLTDPKTWIIGALAALLVYQLLFTSEKRERRTRRRTALKSAEEKFRAELQRIRGIA